MISPNWHEPKGDAPGLREALIVIAFVVGLAVVVQIVAPLVDPEEQDCGTDTECTQMCMKRFDATLDECVDAGYGVWPDRPPVKEELK